VYDIRHSSHLLADDDFQKVALLENGLFIENECKKSKRRVIWEQHRTESMTVAVAVAMSDAMRTREHFMMAEVVKLKAAGAY